MIIKIDLELLNVQIRECDIKADSANTDDERELFEGIANLLSSIAYAAENGYPIEVVK